MTNPYENIIENLTEAVIGVDRDKRVTVFNQAAERLTELSRKRAAGSALSDIFSLNGWLLELVDKTFTDKTIYAETRLKRSDYEATLLRKFSPPLPVSVSTISLIDNSGNLSGVAIQIKDVSALKSIESEELRKDRLAYLGTFVANLAHEVKNPLSGIKGAAQLLARRTEDAQFKELTDVIIKESDRLNNVVCDMLDFTRLKKPIKGNLNIHKELDSVIALVEKEKTSIDNNIEVTRVYDPSLPEIKGNSSQLTQVFLNIIKNAKDAVIEKATKDEKTKFVPNISVTTRLASDFKIKQISTNAGEVGKGSFALIEISDNGIGIKNKDIEKVFTPFFTTKHQGSGLGMGISYKIIKEHDGYISIDSEPKEATKIRIYLPLGEAKKCKEQS
jgi:two-component system nitrogen regulation sensor histidine kinase GlnL